MPEYLGIYTCHGTVLYVDDTTKELRHGPIGRFFANTLILPLDNKFVLEYRAKTFSRALACQYDGTLFVPDIGHDDSEPAPIEFECIDIKDGLVALKSADLFLSAEPGGRVTLDRRHCDLWEWFSIPRLMPPSPEASLPNDGSHISTRSIKHLGACRIAGDLEQLARIERELTERNMTFNAENYTRTPGSVSLDGAAVVVGFGGHLFIGDGANMWEQQLSGALRLSSNQLDAWSALLLARTAKAKDLGIRLVHLVAPEKQVVLPQFRWVVLPPSLHDRPVRQILARVSHNSRFLYPAKALIWHQPWCELYWRGNSHWCASGCALAALSLTVELLDHGSPSISQISFERAIGQHDLQQHFLEEVPFEEIIRIRSSGERIYDNMLYEKTGRHAGSHYVIWNHTAHTQEKLVIFGDSYSYDAGLSAAMSSFFREVHFIWSKDILWHYVHEQRARFVVWQSAERFLVTLPTE